MKLPLRTVIERLCQDVLSAPQRIFEAGRSREPALAAHPNAASVLLALDDDAASTYPEREALTRALLAEHQASDTAFWASVLIAAFSPMLLCLRNRLISDMVSSEELDQIVITSFLAAMSNLPFRERNDRVAMYLRQRTQRQVFAFLRKEHEHRAPDDEEEEAGELELESVPAPRSSTNEKIYDLTLLIQRGVEAGVSPGGLDIIEATVLRCELLRDYVERMAPDDDLERERMYQRLKRQRSRALRRLKALGLTRLASGC